MLFSRFPGKDKAIVFFLKKKKKNPQNPSFSDGFMEPNYLWWDSFVSSSQKVSLNGLNLSFLQRYFPRSQRHRDWFCAVTFWQRHKAYDSFSACCKCALRSAHTTLNSICGLVVRNPLTGVTIMRRLRNEACNCCYPSTLFWNPFSQLTSEKLARFKVAEVRSHRG